MTPFELSLAFLACVLVGVVSAIMGIGGGLLLVPLLTLIPGVSMGMAAGTALVCTLATSAAGSVALDKARLAQLEVVGHLELAAAVGAIVSAKWLYEITPPRVAAGAFAVVVGYALIKMIQRGLAAVPDPAPGDADAASPDWPQHWLGGFAGFFLSGVASGLLGIGGSPIKVPVQTEVMKIPVRVALANSNLMVGITAGAGAAIYFARGQIPAALLPACALGITAGAYAGGLIAPKIRARRLTWGFVLILFAATSRMAWKALAPGS